MQRTKMYIAIVMWKGEIDDVISFTSSEEANNYLRLRGCHPKRKGSTVWISHTFDSASEYIKEAE